MNEADALHHRRSYFEGLYREADDPWDFERSPYERRKYAITMASLPLDRYRFGLEPGCANGALSAQLAERCDRLVSFDLLDEPVRRARTRLARVPTAEVRRERFPDYWPEGTGDLVVWSEVAYYLTAAGRDVAVLGLDGFLAVGGNLVCVHYTPPTDYPMTGAAVGRWLDTVPWLRRVVTHLDERFELVAWERTS